MNFSSKKRQKHSSFTASEDEPLTKRPYDNKENESDEVRIVLKPFFPINEDKPVLMSMISGAETSDTLSEPSRESSNHILKEVTPFEVKEADDDEGIFSQLDPKYVPDRLLYREKEINDVRDILKECYLRKKGENIFISGQPGTGKTGSVNYILQHLESEGAKFLSAESEACDATKSKSKNSTKPVQVLRTNAMGFKNTKDLFQFIYEKLRDPKESSKKLPLDTSELLLRITKQAETHAFTVVFIDEFDTLFSKSQNALDMIELYNSGSKLVLISISNSIDSIVKLSKKLKIAQSYHHIVFEPYNFNQIYEILKERVKALNCPGIDGSLFEDQSVLFCAKKLYNSKGSDIRPCLDMLLKAANKKFGKQSIQGTAHGEQLVKTNVIKIQDIKELCEEVEHSEFDGIFATFPVNQQVLILALYICSKQSDRPNVDVKELLKKYNAYCSALYLPKAELMDILDMAANFEDYKIIEKVIPGKASAKKSLGKLTSPFKDSPGKAVEFKPLTSLSQMKQSILKNEILSKFV